MNISRYSQVKPQVISPIGALAYLARPGEKAPELPKQLNDLLAQLRGATGRNQALEILRNASQRLEGLKAEDHINYTFNGEFKISFGLRLYLDKQAENFTHLGNINVQSAPRLVEYIKINNEHGILITHQAECAHRLVPYREAINLVNQTEREMFLAEMQTLLDNNLINEYALKSTGYWYVNPATGKIIVTSWASLREVDSNEAKEDILNTFRGLVEKGYKGFFNHVPSSVDDDPNWIVAIDRPGYFGGKRDNIYEEYD